MQIYLKLDSKQRILELSYDVIDPTGLVLVDVPDDHPIASQGRTNYRYVDGQFIEDNTLYQESQESLLKPNYTIEEYLLDLDFRLSMAEIGLA